MWHQASVMLAVQSVCKGVRTAGMAGEDLQSYYFESGAPGNFSPSANKNINNRPSNKTVAIASNQLHRVEGRSNLIIGFQFGTGTMRMGLIDVGYVPTLTYNLISLVKSVKLVTSTLVMIPDLPCTYNAERAYSA